MYLQYRDKKGNVYFVDLLENKYTLILLTFSWIFPRKIYLTTFKNGLSFEKNKVTIPQITSTVILSKFVAKLIPDFEQKLYIISKKQSYYVLTFLFCIVIALWHFILKLVRMCTLKNVSSMKEMPDKCTYEPKSKFSYLWMIILSLIGKECLITSVSYIQSAALDDLFVVIFLISYIVLLPITSLLLCRVKYNGEELSFIKLI